MWNPFRKVIQADPVFEALANQHICPDCKGESFFMGPKGGAAQNVKCANPECGSEFNLAPFEDGAWLGPPMLVQRIGKTRQI